MMDLVYDRTAEDVAAAKAQRGSLAALKGCYNVSDMNRVNAAVDELAAALNAAGYPVEVNTKTFETGDILRRSDWGSYLSSVQSLRDAYYTLAATGELPDSNEALDFIGANTIEKILADIELLIGKMNEDYRRCGAFRAGNNAVHLPLKGSE